MTSPKRLAIRSGVADRRASRPIASIVTTDRGVGPRPRHAGARRPDSGEAGL